MEREELNDIQLRIVGCLIEKEHTTPDQYPLTLNSIRLACNQKSNRHPVVNFDENEIRRELLQLQNRGVIRQRSLSDSRVPKYEHNFNKYYDCTEKETALLCVLMLRGPQTLGELRTRTQRIHDFSSLEEIERILSRLENREDSPYAQKLERQPGQKESRYEHCLGGTKIAPQDQTASSQSNSSNQSELEARVTALEEQVQLLSEKINNLMD